ncbi:VTT domain-containing protein [Salinarimonas ramus]|uniref:Phospholipase D n=1 Tax=Salinarimonas ramus TaxID=690164 RepID=A0A917QG22_9HYPH|nr:VTT domain-containing protein [Salinarimonas ramus]GGK49669.1 phospholipase [Salinarimonas ramus]
MALGESGGILRPGETVWTIARAGRAAALVDAAATFGAMRAAMLNARSRILVVGWDIDSRTPLVGEEWEPADGLPRELGPFLRALVERRPRLKVDLLLWDYALLYGLERELLPEVKLDWSMPRQIRARLDDVLPIGASHHQKIVVVDGALAFCGGLDLAIRRWDTRAHAIDDTRLRDPDGAPYRPFHDAQMIVDGEAAHALAALAEARWRQAEGGYAAAPKLPKAAAPSRLRRAPPASVDPWPEGLVPDFRDVAVGIARTRPDFAGAPAIREVEALYLASVAAAERTIYVENQFLTRESVARAIATRLAEVPTLEVVLVGPNVHQSWHEEHSMNAGRRRFMAILEASGCAGRVRLLYPAVPDDPTGEGVMVHAKLMIVDDRLLRIGSSNLNNRSMGLDSECDLAIEAHSEAERAAIARIRDGLLAEHAGVSPDEIADATARDGSLLAAIESFPARGRRLAPIDLGTAEDGELARRIGEIADPETPIATPAFGAEMFAGQPAQRSLLRTGQLVLLALAIVAIVALWRFSPASTLTDPAELVEWLEALGTGPFAPLLVVLAFVVGGLLVFPVTVLITVTGMMFAPVPAIALATTGVMLSAAMMYVIGRAVGRGALERRMGRRTRAVSKALADSGVIAVAALRMLPVAPFSVVNLVVGASRIGLFDYLAGTLIGMAPGLVMLTLLGTRLAEVLASPDPWALALLGLAFVAWLALSVGLQVLVYRIKRKRRAAKGG